MEEHELSFGRWLQHRRLALHYTQQHLGLLVACSTATIRKIEADERRPSYDVAHRLATALQITDRLQTTFVCFARGESMYAPSMLPPRAKEPAPMMIPCLPVSPRKLEGCVQEAVVLLLIEPNMRLLTLTGPDDKVWLIVQRAGDVLDHLVGDVSLVDYATIDDPQRIV